MEGITGPQRRLNDELLAGIHQAQIDFAVVQHRNCARADAHHDRTLRRIVKAPTGPTL